MQYVPVVMTFFALIKSAESSACQKKDTLQYDVKQRN